MAIIERNRTLRPSSRMEKSSYKIDTKKVGKDDTLYINIYSEESDFYQRYKIEGKIISDKNSLHFKADKNGNTWEINWIGTSPQRVK